MSRIHRWLALTTAALLTVAPAQAATPDNLREELITQALSGWDGSVTVKLLPGALPSDFPLKLAGLPGVRLVGSLVRTVPTPEQTGQTVIVGGQSVSALSTTLRGTLTQAGFKPYPSMRGEPSGGFLPAEGASRFPFAYYRYTQATTPGAGGQRASVMVYQQAGRTYGQIVLDAAPRLAEELRSAQNFAERDPMSGLPALTPPNGVTVFPMGGGGGSSSFSVTASIQGKQSAAQLSEHYGQQLVAAGWQRISRITPKDQVVTIWSFERDGQAHMGILALRQNAPESLTGLLMTVSC